MMDNLGGIWLFSNGNILDFIRSQEEKVKIEIGNLSDERILGYDNIQVKTLADKYSVTPITCAWEKIKAEIKMEQRPINLASGEMSRSGVVNKATVKYTIPFSGSTEVLEYVPSTFTTSQPDVLAYHNTLEFTIWTSSSTEDLSDENQDQVRREKEAILERLKTEIGRLNNDITRFNSNLMGIISPLISNRAQAVAKKRNIEKSL